MGLRVEQIGEGSAQVRGHGLSRFQIASASRCSEA
jgi:hypothetical protein